MKKLTDFDIAMMYQKAMPLGPVQQLIDRYRAARHGEAWAYFMAVLAIFGGLLNLIGRV